MKLKVVIKQFILFALISSASGNLFSQKLCFEIKPCYSFLFGTYRTKLTSPESSIEFVHKKPGNISFAIGSLGFDLTVFSYKKSTFGISYFTGSSKTELAFHYTSTGVTDSLGNTSEKLTTQGPTNIINQLGLFYTFSSLRPTRETTGISLQHHFSLYAYYLQDHTNFLPLYDGYTHMTDGDLFDDFENYKEVYEGRNGFAMMCRYDISFFTRKKRLNVINAFVSFQQGFRLMDRITLEVKHENGAYLNAYSRTNGSYFSIGIAKPISIYPNRWLHLKKKNP